MPRCWCRYCAHTSPLLSTHSSHIAWCSYKRIIYGMKEQAFIFLSFPSSLFYYCLFCVSCSCSCSFLSLGCTLLLLVCVQVCLLSRANETFFVFVVVLFFSNIFSVSLLPFVFASDLLSRATESDLKKHLTELYQASLKVSSTPMPAAAAAAGKSPKKKQLAQQSTYSNCSFSPFFSFLSFFHSLFFLLISFQFFV